MNNTIQLLEQNALVLRYIGSHNELLIRFTEEFTTALQLLMKAQSIVVEGQQAVFKLTSCDSGRVELTTKLHQPDRPATILRFCWHPAREWGFYVTYCDLGGSQWIHQSRADNLVALMKLVKKKMKKISKNSDPYISVAL